jgi:hypothetical protein
VNAEYQRRLDGGETTLKAYQPALSEIINSLDAEDLQRCTALANAWNEGVWPQQLQQE